MYAEDFVYDGVALSDYDFVIVNFDQSGLEVRDTGSKITMNLVSSNYGKHYDLAGSSYDACISCTFHICKNPDKFNMDEMAITSDEYRDIVRWLNRREFHKMQFISCCSEEDMKEMPYYNATFNVNKLVLGEVVYGIELTMQTDSPFGYFDSVTKQLTVSGGTPALNNNSARYAVKLLDAGGSEVNTSSASDLKLRVSKASVNVGPSYGEDGNALNITGDTHNLTLVPKYDASSDEVGYQVSDVGFSTTMYSDEANLLATDATAQPDVLYRQYETVGTSLTGSLSTIYPTVSSSGTSDNITTLVYDNARLRDLAAGETLIVSARISSVSYYYGGKRYYDYFNVTADVYGDVEGNEVVAATFIAGDGYQYNTTDGPDGAAYHYYAIKGLKIRREDIQAWEDRGVYKVRVTISYRASNKMSADPKFTILSTSGTYNFSFLNTSSGTYDHGDCVRIVASNYADQWNNRMLTYKNAESGSYPVMYSDGLAWYHVYDTGELGESGASAATDTSEPVAYRSREIALFSGQSAIFTNVFGEVNEAYGAALIRKVTNGTDTYTQAEIIDTRHDGSYMSYGPMPYTMSAVPNGYTLDGSIMYTSHAEDAIGNGSDTTSTGGVLYSETETTYATVRYSFDFSSIPAGATIDSVSVSVKGRYEGYSDDDEESYSVRSDLYVTDTDGTLMSDVASLNNGTTTATRDYVVTLSLYDGWTRESLLGAHLCFEVGWYGGAVSGVTWVVNYVGTPNGESTETRSVASCVAKYDDAFFSNYGNTYTRSAYIEYSYDDSSSTAVTDVRAGTPVGLLRGNGGSNYDNMPTVAYDGENVYKAYDCPYYVYFDNSNGHVYVSDGILWKLFSIVTDAYYTTEKFEIDDDEMLICYAEYTGFTPDKTIYKLIGVDDGDMEIAGSQTFASSFSYVYATITSDAFTDYTNGQRYVQFRYPLNGLLTSGVKISKVSKTASDADIIIGYSTTATATSALASIASAHIVGTSVNYSASGNTHKLFLNTYNRYLYASDGSRWYYYSTVADSGERMSLAIQISDASYISCGAEFGSATTKTGYFYLEGASGGSLTTDENTISSATRVRYTVDMTDGNERDSFAAIADYTKYLRYVYEGDNISSAVVTVLANDSGNNGLLHVSEESWTSGQASSIGQYAASSYPGYLALSSSTNLYFSDGSYWFYVMTGIREDEYMTTRLDAASGDYVSFSVDFSEISTFTIKMVECGTYNGKFYYSTNSYNYASASSGTCISNSDTFTVGSIEVERQGVYFIFPWTSDCTYTVARVYTGAPVGILTGSDGEDCDGQQAISAGGGTTYSASSYPYYLCVDRANNYLYASDGSFWHHLKNTTAGQYATANVSIADGEMVIFYVTYANSKSFTVTKEVIASSDAYVGGNITDSYTYSGSGTTLALAAGYNDIEFTRYGTEFTKYVRFIYPYETGVSVSLRKIYIGDPKGVIALDDDPAHGYNQSSSAGDKTVTHTPYEEDGKYPAATYLSYVSYNKETGDMFVSDGTYWWLVKNALTSETDYYVQSASLSSSTVSNGNRIVRVDRIGDDDTIILSVNYPSAQDVSAQVIRGVSSASMAPVTSSYLYTGASRVVLYVRATDAAFIGTSDSDGRYAQFIFPDEDAEWLVTKATANSGTQANIEYGYNGGNFDGAAYVENDYAAGGSAKYDASDYAYSLYMDEANGYVYASDGVNWHYLTSTNLPYYKDVFIDFSDEIGYSYPDVVVTVNEGGRYVLQNDTYGTSTEINNCSVGEVITMHGRTQTIETSLATHDIAKDFNFEFLRIGNTYESRENVIKYRLPATTTIIHTPLAKDLT